MAEALGIVTSIIQLLDTGLKALEYVKDFVHAAEERRKLAAEMATLKPMLVELENRVRANPTSRTLQQMKDPLLRFKTALGLFIDTLRPAEGHLSKVSKQLTWTLWNKKEAQEHLAEFERIKSLFTVSLAGDVWDAGTTAERERILNWITSLNSFQRQADIFSAWQPGTGEWLLADARFRDWESSAERILWCRGIPGAGKTVLACVVHRPLFCMTANIADRSMVVNHLRLQSQNTNTAVACIYLNHKETEMQSLVDLLASLWKQLVVGKPLPPAVHELYDAHHEKGTRPSLDDVLNILCASIGEYSKVYLIVDALDEYSEDPRLKLLEYLSMVMTTPTINLMLTSRPHITLDPFLSGRRTLDINTTEDDIRQYIDERIRKSPRLSKHVQTRPELSEEIKSRILSNVDGMFLLAKLHLDSLSTKNTIKAVRDALHSLPKDLDGTYDEAMERIEHQNEDDRQLANMVLTWVAYAVRPLLVDELREALAVEPEAGSVDPDNLLDSDIILSVCAGLVIIDETTSVVRLIHYTTQEYMFTIQQHRFPHAYTEIASILFAYLASPDFVNLPESVEKQWKLLREQHGFLESLNMPRPEDKQKKLVLKHPLLGYSQYCLLYAAGQAELQLQNQIKSFFATAHSWQRFWCSYHVESRLHVMYYWNYPGWDQLSASPLAISASADLLITANHLLTQGQFERNEGLDALCVASCYGHLEMIQLLVENGVDINYDDHGRFEEALQAAAEMGHEAVVRFLIHLGVNVNAQEPESGTAMHPRSCWEQKIDSFNPILLVEQGAYNKTQVLYGTALTAASYCGHELIVRLLIEKGADTNMHGGYFGTALIAASHEGHQPVVQLLLEYGANINALIGVFGTALHAAVIKDRRSLALLLIEKGADINAHGGYCGTVLQAATREHNDSMVELLIKMGADVNGRGDINGDGTFYGTALQIASRGGDESLAALLIENGADVNALGGIYGTALQSASFFGHESVVKLLIKEGADVNAPSGTHGTALEAASTIFSPRFDNSSHNSPKKAIIRLLIENGVDVNANGRIALQMASSQGNDDMVEFLINLGADVNMYGGRFGTPLLAAAYKGHESTVRLLLGNNADTNAEEEILARQLALLVASEGGGESVVRLLISLGADVNAVVEGAPFATALQAASGKGHESIARLLIEKGADVNMCGGFIGTALLAASRAGHEPLVRLLIAKKANINYHHEFHGTALQATSKAGYESLARLLIEMGADVNVPGGDLKTLSAAALNRLANILLRQGFDVDDLSKVVPELGVFGTALQVASEGGHESVVRLLIENGANGDLVIPAYVRDDRGSDS